MSYASSNDLAVRFGSEELIQLTDRVGTNTIDAAVVADALADTDALINTYLGSRYAVPVAPTPALLLSVACDVARFKLYGNAAPPAVRLAFEDAQRVLKDLSSGAAVLVGAAPVVAGSVPAAAPGVVRVSAPDRASTPALLSDFLG